MIKTLVADSCRAVATALAPPQPGVPHSSRGPMREEWAVPTLDAVPKPPAGPPATNDQTCTTCGADLQFVWITCGGCKAKLCMTGNCITAHTCPEVIHG